MASKYLGRRDVEPHQPVSLSNGEQIRVDHVGCPAGNDGKRRLAVKRDGRDLVLWCHHCRRGGVVKGQLSPALKRNKAVEREPFNPDAPRHWLYYRRQWPPEAVSWVLYAGLYQHEEADIGYDPASGRVALPVWDRGALVGYQLRRLDDGQGPKYLARWAPGAPPMMYTPGKDHTTLVVVEDWLSGRKASRAADTLTVFGTTVPLEALMRAAGNGYRKVVIALDNDNATVRRLQTDAQWAFAMVVPEVVVRHLDRDVKELNVEELQELIR